MEVKKVNKKLRMTTKDVIRYQIMTEIMFFRNETLIPSDIEILTLLIMWGPIELGTFCSEAVAVIYPDAKAMAYSVRAQNIRNRIVKLEKRGIIVKSNTGRKTISLNPEISIFSKGNILLDYNYLAIESVKA
jgi:hypothetical protein